ncbi:MAG TPA: hypothetical protein EYQ75_17840 [Planctomycetaceae bacterium]|nr:hypothetical protein [Planctomycetaceae bacterium]
MAIELICECGAKLKAKPELAGKQVKCPTCAKTMTVPKPAEVIRVSCQCGKVFKANAKLAGKKMSCPSCGQPLSIPDDMAVVDPLSLASAADDPLGLGDIDAAALPALPRTERSLPTRRPVSRPKSSKSADRPRNGNSTVVDMVAGGFAVLHGVIAAYGILQMISLIVRNPRVFGLSTLFSLAMIPFLLSAIASVCILVAGIGVLTHRKKWALEFGMPASFVYFGLLAFALLKLVWAIMSLGAPGANIFLAMIPKMVVSMIPKMVVSAIGPAMLIYISRTPKRRR